MRDTRYQTWMDRCVCMVICAESDIVGSGGRVVECRTVH